MTNSRKQSLGIQRVASSYVFVRDLERSRDHYLKNLGFAALAVQGASRGAAQNAV